MNINKKCYLNKEYEIKLSCGFYSIYYKKTNVIIANYKDLNTAENHLNSLNKLEVK